MGVQDVILTNGYVIDPANGVAGFNDIAIADGLITNVQPSLATVPRHRTLDLDGQIVSPGLVDLHVHVFQWFTPFGLSADAAGIDAGCTTIVDQGSAGAWTLGGFIHSVVMPSKTDVRSFLSVNLAGALKGGRRGDVLHNPGMVDVGEIVKMAKAYPAIVRGVKCHGESGGISNWGFEVLNAAVEAGNRAGLPLYCHTGELFPVKEENRPPADEVLGQVIPLMRAGDTLAHVYSSRPDGIMGRSETVPPHVFQALEKGIHFDIGYGVNFSYDIARQMMSQNVLPHTISSDVHGEFNDFHDDSRLNYSLCGAMTRLWALGMPLEDVIRRVTVNPARILQDDSIGTLTPGTRADVTVLRKVPGPWMLRDPKRRELIAPEKIVPSLVVRNGEVHTPSNAYIRDMNELAH